MGKSFLLEPGTKFNKLTVIELVEQRLYISPKGKKHTKKYYKCKCECGKETIVYQGKLVSGQTKSCGCLTEKHGLYKSRLYNIWRGILKRCYLISSKDYKRYGARNIKVYEQWKTNFSSFYEWSINNGYKNYLTIDRININGDYEPSNCRWISSKEQANNRSNNRLITHNGETLNITQWAEKLNINRHILYQKKIENIKKILG